MKVFIVTPSFAVHGGIRIILEWANRLTAFHEVYLHSQAGGVCTWFEINSRVIQTSNQNMSGMDCLIITSPLNIDFQDRPDTPRKVFIFAQMAEHLFMDHSQQRYNEWYKTCLKFYTSQHPMISISKWNMELFQSLGRTTRTYYIGNGVNLDHFPISDKPKDNKTILVEGWECGNPSKDFINIGPKVAAQLKFNGYKIIAYSQKPLKTMSYIPDEYYQYPSLPLLNELYERATIMIKATVFDARSCSPVEAMTKGTITVRAINKGDDDLMDEINCLRAPYNEQALYNCCEHILTNRNTREIIANNARLYVQENCDWNKIIQTINNILTNG